MFLFLLYITNITLSRLFVTIVLAVTNMSLNISIKEIAHMNENVFGERLTKLREERKLTTQKVADDLGISRVSITHYEKGQRKPDIEILTKLSRYFGVSSDYLLGLSVSPTNNKSLGFVCNYLNLPDQVIEKIKANSDDTLTQILDSNEFWEVKRWLNIAIRYRAYLKPNADLAAISSMDSAGLILDGRTPQDVPTAYTDMMKAVALTGTEPLYKNAINDLMSKMFDTIVSQE